jgi:hypothetical protein
MTEEEWRDIPGYVGEYQASSLGRIRSLGMFAKGRDGSKRWIYGRILKPCCGNYDTVGLRGKTHYIHDLVTATFLGQKNGRCVRHGRKGKRDNRLDNLSYSGWSKNQIDRYRDGTMQCKSVIRSDGVEFESLHIAARVSNISVGDICKVCRKQRKTAGGFGWEYKD